MEFEETHIRPCNSDSNSTMGGSDAKAQSSDEDISKEQQQLFDGY
jgi:hypothetical protein